MRSFSASPSSIYDGLTLNTTNTRDEPRAEFRPVSLFWASGEYSCSSRRYTYWPGEIKKKHLKMTCSEKKKSRRSSRLNPTILRFLGTWSISKNGPNLSTDGSTRTSFWKWLQKIRRSSEICSSKLLKKMATGKGSKTLFFVNISEIRERVKIIFLPLMTS